MRSSYSVPNLTLLLIGLLAQSACFQASEELVSPVLNKVTMDARARDLECVVGLNTPGLSGVLQDFIDERSCTRIEITAGEDDVLDVQLDSPLVIHESQSGTRTLELIGPAGAGLPGPALLAPSGKRHFDVQVEGPGSALELRLSHLILRGGDVSAATESESQGGALRGISKNGKLTLVVDNSRFEGNSATHGGAIFLQALSEDNTLQLSNVTLENNRARLSGGAIF
ncbi:MAG: hypothetical protein QGI45_03620, partial [Myxococcota bacterium]|nr:hypothetical protein [Myxococcota bacterium]